MIQAPGLNKPGTAPRWLAEIQICHEFHLSEEQYRKTSLAWKQWAMTYLRGRARGEEQRARKERARK